MRPAPKPLPSQPASPLGQPLLPAIDALAAETISGDRFVVGGPPSDSPESPSLVSRSGHLDLLPGAVGADDDRATLPEEQLQAEEDAQFEAVSAATVGPLTSAEDKILFVREKKLLDEMTEIAEAARGLPDARVRRLAQWIREKMCPGHVAASLRDAIPVSERPAHVAGTGTRSVPPALAGARWNDIRIIIFTEYDDSKRYLQQQLSALIEGSERADERIAIYHGPTPPAQRKEIQRAFQADPAKHPVRILIATDAAREGLNLQAHCWNLFHFDVPWNPRRLCLYGPGAARLHEELVPVTARWTDPKVRKGLLSP